MAAFTYLSESEAAAGRTVPGDKECSELLAEARALTGGDWIVRTYKRRDRWSWRRPLAPREPWIAYELLLGLSGEWQVINLVTAGGGSVFFEARDSRSHVMNFMMGLINGWQDAMRRVPAGIAT